MRVIQGDCLEEMDKLISEGVKVDAIITDIPYGTTACKWDEIIPFNDMWGRLKKLRKDKTPIVLFGSQPFTSKLVSSNIDEFKYEIIWRKERPTNFMLGKKQIMKYHENILLFYKNQCTFNPIREKKLEKNKRNNAPRGFTNRVYNIDSDKYSERTSKGGNKDWIYPKSIQYFTMERGLHPTQKPVDLMEYLIKTYTNEGDIILDFTMGSGTTGVACKNLNRKFIGIELDEEYFNIAKDRIENS